MHMHKKLMVAALGAAIGSVAQADVMADATTLFRMGLDVPSDGGLVTSDSQIVPTLPVAAASRFVESLSGPGKMYIRTEDVTVPLTGEVLKDQPCLYFPVEESSGDTVYEKSKYLALTMAKEKADFSSGVWSAYFRIRCDAPVHTTGMFATMDWSWSFCRSVAPMVYCQSSISDDFSTKPMILGGYFGRQMSTFVPNLVLGAPGQWIDIVIVMSSSSSCLAAVANGTHPVQFSSCNPAAYGNNAGFNYSGGIRENGTVGIGAGAYSNNSSDWAKGANNARHFVGSMHRFAMWNRALSTNEILEVFSEKAPTWRLGADNGTAGEFAGSDTGAVSVNAALWEKTSPVISSSGRTFKFNVGSGSADYETWVRFKPDLLSAAGKLSVKVNSSSLSAITITPGESSYIKIPAKKLKTGENTLVLTRTDGGSGNIMFDYIEMNGSWSIGKPGSWTGDFNSSSDSKYKTLNVGDAHTDHYSREINDSAIRFNLSQDELDHGTYKMRFLVTRMSGYAEPGTAVTENNLKYLKKDGFTLSINGTEVGSWRYDAGDFNENGCDTWIVADVPKGLLSHENRALLTKHTGSGWIIIGRYVLAAQYHSYRGMKIILR